MNTPLIVVKVTDEHVWFESYPIPVGDGGSKREVQDTFQFIKTTKEKVKASFAAKISEHEAAVTRLKMKLERIV